MVGKSKVEGKTASKRQKLMSDFFSQSQSSSILAHETQPSQMGKETNKTRSKIGTQVVANSQAEFSDSDEDLFRTKNHKDEGMRNPMSQFQSDDEEIIIKETVESQMQRPIKKKDGDDSDVVYDSQEEKDFSDDDVVIDLDDVHSQMDFRPQLTSTQKNRCNLAVNTSLSTPGERKRKKTSALTERSAKKPATVDKRNGFFDAADPKERVVPPTPEVPSKKSKLSSLSFLGEPVQEVLYVEESQNLARRKAPSIQKATTQKGKKAVQENTEETQKPTRKRTVATQKATTQKGKKQSSLSFSDDEGVDLTLISTGKTYDTEDNQSFLSNLNNAKSSTYTEEDISKISACLNDLIEVMPVSCKISPPIQTKTSTKTPSQSTKKFKKAAQGRFNPRLPNRISVITDDVLKDFRDF